MCINKSIPGPQRQPVLAYAEALLVGKVGSLGCIDSLEGNHF